MNVFLSHSNHPDDLNIIELLNLGFRLIGVNLYIAERDPKPSDRLSDKLKSKIDASDAVLVLYSSYASESKDVNWEVGYAAGKKRIYFISEWGVSKPVAHQGEEDFSLDRQKIIESIYPVCLYFKRSGSGSDEQKAKKEFEYSMIIVPASGDGRFKLRIQYPKSVDLKYAPEYITGEILCAGCKILLVREYSIGYRHLQMVCKSCGNYLSLGETSQLKAKTISDFIKSETTRKK